MGAMSRKGAANQALEATPVGAFCSAVAGLAFWPGVPEFV